MDYAESAALMNNTLFKGRVKVAILKYSNSILSSGASLPSIGANAILRWASHAYNDSERIAQQVIAPVVMDASVQNQSEHITDEALQKVVESVVNKTL